MRGDPESLQPKSHAKAQRAPREIFGSSLLFLKISLIPPYSIKKNINFLSILASWREIKFHAKTRCTQERIPILIGIRLLNHRNKTF